MAAPLREDRVIHPHERALAKVLWHIQRIGGRGYDLFPPPEKDVMVMIYRREDVDHPSGPSKLIRVTTPDGVWEEQFEDLCIVEEHPNTVNTAFLDPDVYLPMQNALEDQAVKTWVQVVDTIRPAVDQGLVTHQECMGKVRELEASVSAFVARWQFRSLVIMFPGVLESVAHGVILQIPALAAVDKIDEDQAKRLEQQINDVVLEFQDRIAAASDTIEDGIEWLKDQFDLAEANITALIRRAEQGPIRPQGSQ